MMKRVWLYCIIAAFFQVTLVTESRSQGASRVVDYLPSSTNGKFLKVYQAEKKEIIGASPGVDGFQYGLEVDGKLLPFQNGETYMGAAQDIVYTRIMNSAAEKADEVIIKSWKAEGGKLTLNGSLKLKHAYYSVYPIASNRNVLTSDEWEGWGSEISLYGPKMNLIASIQPFGKGGFERSLISIEGDRAGLVFFPLDKMMPAKLVFLNLLNGEVLFEEKLKSSPAYTISTIKVVGDNLLLTQHLTPENQELLCFNKSGELVWQKNAYVYALEGVRQNTKWAVFAMDKENYWFFNLADGKVSGKKRIADLVGNGVIGPDKWIDLTSFEGGAGVALLASAPEKSTGQYTHDFFVITPDGKATKNKSLKSTSEVLSLKKVSTSVLLNDSNNQIIYVYEKAN